MMNSVRLTGDMDWGYTFPSTRITLGPVQTWVHSLSFADMHAAKQLAVAYTGLKTNRNDYQNIKPDEDTLKVCQLIYACRQEENSKNMTFEIILGQEFQGIDRLLQLLPKAIIDAVCNISDNLSTSTLVPIHDEKKQQEIDDARTFLIDTFSDEDTWEHLNYFCLRMFSKPLSILEDMPIGDALNILSRDEKVVNMMTETVMAMMEAMHNAKV